MRIKLICIGKIKKSYWQDAAADYIHRLSKYYALEMVELKDGPRHLSSQERMQVEAQNIQAKTSSRDMRICLDSRGRALSSPQMGQKLKAWLEKPGSIPCFILGGAYGLAEQVTSSSSMLLSFGPMTLPHELARIVLLEQLYRATTIIHNHPYHH
ncbi:MAG: 23S rRNA (pseudouridine(1915)-N(3))-methyltransferase RlmH [Desulfovermiculus sp.]